MAKIEKIFKSYRDQLLHLAKLYGIVEIKSYARSAKRLTTNQLELLLIKNHIKLPVNRSSDKAIAKQELKENSIRNIYLSIAILFFIASMITVRPYIKKVVNEVKFTYVAQEYKSPKKIEKQKSDVKEPKSDDNNVADYKALPDNTISLNAETTLNLFEDLKYDLKSIRNGAKVKPVYLTKLPKDLKSLGDTKQKRELFIKIILPLILDENAKILEDRKKLFKILSKNFNTPGERVWLKRRFKEYKIDDKDLGKLKMRMDIIPVSIAIAQAANESGWGTSRFALEGNAMFGQWTYGKDGIAPLEREKNKDHKILKFPMLRSSVQAYKNNLNTHSGYKEFRKKRADLRRKNQNISGLALVNYLHNYAATGKEYTDILKKIIDQNSLTDFDNAILMNSNQSSSLTL